MPIEFISENREINRSNYIDKILKNFIPGIETELKKKGFDLEKINKFKGFVFYVLTPVYENYIQEKFRKERGVNLDKTSIDADDKMIFPNGIKTGVKYFNDFINDYRSGKIEIPSDSLSGDRDFDEYMNIYFSLSDNTKKLVFKEVYYAMYGFNSFTRNFRATVKLLDELKSEIKK